MPQKSHSHYRTLLLLLVAYGLATWLPQPGFWLRDLRIFPQSFCPGIQIQHAMLALMLGACAVLPRKTWCITVCDCVAPLSSVTVTVT